MSTMSKGTMSKGLIRMLRNYMVISISLVFCLTLSGCTIGKRELNDLALVLAVGLDKGSKESTIKVTTQIVRPVDARGQTGAPSGQTGDPIWSASAEGETIFQAIRNLSTFSSRRIFWAHNFIIVINEELAREGIGDIIDFFTRNPELRMRTWVVVTPDPASQVVSTMTGLEVVPGESMDKLFRYAPISAQAPKTQMLDLQSAYLSDSAEPILARARLISRGVSNKKPGQQGAYKQVQLAGAGVFKHDKLVGIINPIDVRRVIPFLEPMDNGVLIVPCPDKPNKKMTIELRNHKFSVRPSYKNNRPIFDITYKTTGSIVESPCPLSLDERKKVKDLEATTEKILKKEFRIVIDKAQKKYKSDFLQLGKVFQNKYPMEWRTMAAEWEEIFPKAEVRINTKVEVNDTVLLKKPMNESRRK